MFLGDKQRVGQIDDWFKLRTDLVDQLRSFGPSLQSGPSFHAQTVSMVRPGQLPWPDVTVTSGATPQPTPSGKYWNFYAHPRCATKKRDKVCSWGPRAKCFSVDLLGSATELGAETLRDVYFAPDILESCSLLLGQSAGLWLAYEAFKFCLQPASIKWGTGMKTFWNKMLHDFSLCESLSVLI